MPGLSHSRRLPIQVCREARRMRPIQPLLGLACTRCVLLWICMSRGLSGRVHSSLYREKARPENVPEISQFSGRYVAHFPNIDFALHVLTAQPKGFYCRVSSEGGRILGLGLGMIYNTVEGCHIGASSLLTSPLNSKVRVRVCCSCRGWCRGWRCRGRRNLNNIHGARPIHRVTWYCTTRQVYN